MVVGILSERDTWCLFLRYYSIVLELASHIFLQVSVVRLSVQWFYFSSYFSPRCVSRSARVKFGITFIRWTGSGRHHLHHHHHHHLHFLQTRYLHTGTRRNVNFLTTRLHGPLRCARTSSDHLSPPVRAKVRSWRLGWDALKDAIDALAHAY